MGLTLIDKTKSGGVSLGDLAPGEWFKTAEGEICLVVEGENGEPDAVNVANGLPIDSPEPNMIVEPLDAKIAVSPRKAPKPPRKPRAPKPE